MIRPPALDYARIFDALPSPYLIMTADFVIVTVNSAYAEATMIEPRAVVGQPLFDVFPDNPADPDADGVHNLRRSLQTVVDTGQADAMAVQRYDIRTPDGRFVVRYWSPVNTPLLADDGTVALIVHRVQDVTDLVELRRSGREQRRTAEALQTRLAAMEADLFIRGRELQETNRELQRVNTELAVASAELRAQQQAKDRFIATLSHELRNPLAAARAALDVLALSVPDHPAGAVLDRQLTALVRMTDDLLEAARIVAGRLHTSPRPLDLREVVTDTVRDVRAAHPGAVDIPVSVPPAPVAVEGDPVRLAQMVTNLVDNAYKHAPAGTPVDVDLVTGAGQAVLRVHDAGPGFPSEAADRVFDPFMRADEAAGSSGDGLGLGLAVVRGIAELHDGSVSAHTDDTGATFTVRLPLTNADPAANPSDPRAARPADRPARRILLVEDNTDLADMYASLLRARGDTVVAATNGSDALAATDRQRFDLVLCDLALADGLDGHEVARRLRANPAYRHTPLVAVSGFSQDADRRRSRAAGFDAHLAKPLDPAELDRLLARWRDG